MLIILFYKYLNFKRIYFYSYLKCQKCGKPDFCKGRATIKLGKPVEFNDKHTCEPDYNISQRKKYNDQLKKSAESGGDFDDFYTRFAPKY